MVFHIVSTSFSYCWWFRYPAFTTWTSQSNPGEIMVEFNYLSLNWCNRPISEPSTVFHGVSCYSMVFDIVFIPWNGRISWIGGSEARSCACSNSSRKLDEQSWRWPMTDPWDERYIYLYEWLKCMVNVGTCTIQYHTYMDLMGFVHDCWLILISYIPATATRFFHVFLRIGWCVLEHVMANHTMATLRENPAKSCQLLVGYL